MAVFSFQRLSSIPSPYFVGLVLFIGLAYLTARRHDSREPVYLKPAIPIVGHVIGILTYGVAYYEKVSKSRNVSAPIFTLDLLVNRLYVINSAKIVPIIQKNHKIIAFDPFLTAAANRLAGINGAGLKLLQETRSGGGDLNNKVLHSMTPSLLGNALDKMNRTMLLKLGPLMEERITTANQSFDLHKWCRHVITVASTEAIWGSKNPFRDEKVVEDFWYFESHLSPLLANVFPRITARRSFQARETVYRAMLKYARAGGYADEDCSELAKSRWQTQTDAGATEENIARLETAVNVGVLSNTVPSTFWTIFEVLSDPDLLEAVRAEIRSNAMEVDPATKVHAIDLSRIRAGCPTLVSAFQEVLRVHSNGAPTRMVYEDILLDDRYLLKAGSVLQLPAPAINGDGSQWGSDPKKFDHTRFQAREQQINARGTVHLKPRATSYMSFGASPNLCPGRHFAAAEILSLVAMLVMRVDITPTKGEWWVPRLNSWAVAASMTPPVEDYPVLIRQRPEYEGVEWTFTVSGFKDKFELITG